MMGRDAAAFLDEKDAQRDQSTSGRGDTPRRRDYDSMMQQREVEMQMQGMSMLHGGGRENHSDHDDDDDDDFMDDVG